MLILFFYVLIPSHVRPIYVACPLGDISDHILYYIKMSIATIYGNY